MKLKLILVALLVAFTCTNAFAKPLKVASVDIKMVIATSKKGLALQKRLQGFATNIQKQLKKQEAEIQQRIETLQGSMMMGDEEKAKEQASLQLAYQTFQQNKQRAQMELQKKQGEETQKLVIQIKKVTAKIAKKKKYDLVLEIQVTQGMLYTAFTINDITEAVSKAYDKIK